VRKNLCETVWRQVALAAQRRVIASYKDIVGMGLCQFIAAASPCNKIQRPAQSRNRCSSCSVIGGASSFQSPAYAHTMIMVDSNLRIGERLHTNPQIALLALTRRLSKTCSRQHGVTDELLYKWAAYRKVMGCQAWLFSMPG
jgi:hypothetical protein